MTANTTKPSKGKKVASPLDDPVVGIGFIEASNRLFKKWRRFYGRASRSEFWWSVLYVWLMEVLFLVLSQFFESFAFAVYGWWVVMSIPMLAISARRLHDANLSGWWMLVPYMCGFAGIGLMLAPFIKVIIALGITDPVQFASVSSKAIAQQLDGGSPLMVLGGILLLVVATVLQTVLFTRPSKPEGARFDKQS